MKASWEQGFNQEVFMEQLVELAHAGRLIEIDGEGVGMIALLRSMVKFSEDLPWEACNKLLWNATNAAMAAQATRPKELLRHIQSAAKAYATGLKSKFVMFTSINVLCENKLLGSRVGEVKLTFPKRMPPRVLSARAALFVKHRSWLALDREPNMRAVKVEVEARNPEEAATQCLDAIDLMRGIWNFFKTPGWRITHGGPRSPVNEIFIGPLHTFHDEAGALLSDQFWYEPNFRKNTEVTDLSESSDAVVRNARTVFKMLDKHRYSNDLRRAFTRYARALDLEDHDLAIQKLWSLLEFLTSTGFDSYETTIRRAKFLCDAALFQGQVLQHLRQYRNRSVHGGSSSGEVEGEVYQLKRLVEAALRFHLGNRFKFNSMAEAGKFLDLPTDVGQLQTQIDQLHAQLKNIRRAIAYRGIGAHAVKHPTGVAN